MGKRSTKDNKNIYQISREESNLTRAQASELMEYVSESRIEKIENDTAQVQPEDVVAMAKAYKKPSLCNYYCTHECQIGQDLIPEIKISSLPEISLGILSSLNALTKQKDRLIEIAEDGRLTEDEFPDFVKIQEQLEKISLTIDSLRLWINTNIAKGEIDKEKLDMQKNLSMKS
ncbi:Helix-turn-helix domain-containing protein [Acetitomaculum ruminis DSM 5522]|uniref:Helix-turn-helix domain-containing protein n=1 Tax=Acetitomaculum ruminis DSM 5522 TaxID=1120918 RepID=A0A1I0X0N4_9FIRM|nr:helix-turn-helix transcriptional regulator [Acetitomaculum ruminis]SFA94384.1 Helix-turn-helix domain-containing protein [Acetitomaculum ruminis DSM 5522]